MKKIILITIFTLVPFVLTACGDKSTDYVGYWQGEANMIFEVLTENGNDFIIRNINGDLKAKIENGALRGKNTLDMEYSMTVKGDSAYYDFGSITTGYKRISKDKYEEIYSTQKKAVLE